jgi:type I restriction enzyme, S subunit
MSVLEQHFDLAFAAPDGIKKLRGLILTLAMQGKLVPQDPNDEPASELLRSIESERNRLIKEGKYKKPLPLPEIEHDELPYQLPKSWKWVRLGHLFRVTSGNNLTKDKMQKGSFPVYGGNGIAGYHDEFNTERPTIVIGRVGYYCGSIHLTPERAWITDNAFFTIYDEERLYQKFVIWLLKTINLQVDTSATAQPVISGGKIYPILIPLPPLAEQRRIVAKIEQLMARCDELEKLRVDRSQRLLTVHTAAIDRLLTAKDSSEFSTAWSFITQNFSELYSVKENVTELRKTILQLAVMGKLVPQDLNDEPASIQFNYIRQQADEIVRKKIEREVKFKSINAKDESFSLPENWLWVKLGSLLKSLKYGTSKKCEYNSPGTAVLRIPNIDVDLGCIDIEKLKYTNLLQSELGDLCLIPNDLLIIRSNGSLSLVGRTAVISEAEEGLAYAGYLVRLRSFPEYVYSRYLYFALNTVSVREQIEQPIRSTSGVKNINSTEISNISIPLPPLAEQGRIVEKIDRLMGMCDRLEGSIESSKVKQTELLNALMSQV